MIPKVAYASVWLTAIAIAPMVSAVSSEQAEIVRHTFDNLRNYPFNPVVAGFTKEPALEFRDGVANLSDEAWRVRSLAIRDLVRVGTEAIPLLHNGLLDENEHVRQVSAFVLGLVGGEGTSAALQQLLRDQNDPVSRSQAAISLGQLGREDALPLLEALAENETNRDVRHQCELAAYRIRRKLPVEEDLAAAYAALEPESFNRVRVGEPAPDFVLKDTDGKPWSLSDFKGEKTIALIWIFADWCPVCHGEFNDLIDLRQEFEDNGIEVVTLECHDTFRSRVMVGKELEPRYWFTKQSPQSKYTQKVWWSHLVDGAGAVAAKYGVQPMEFVVHAEWINRPATVIVDREGIVRFAYYGTYWGDRPSIEQTLEMIEQERFDFEHPKRLKLD